VAALSEQQQHTSTEPHFQTKRDPFVLIQHFSRILQVAQLTDWPQSQAHYIGADSLSSALAAV
jgi:hypothetical protein